MGRVLLSAPNDKPWSWASHLSRAFREIGQEAALLDFRSARRPNIEMLTLAEAFRPQVHLAYKGERYSPEAIAHLSERGVYNVIWHVDEDIPRWLPPLAGAADLCCHQYRGMLEPMRRAGIRDIEWLMEGITPSALPPAPMSAEDRRTYGCQIVTVGTIDRTPEYRERLHALNRLIEEGLDVKWWGRHMSFRRNSLRDWLSPAHRAWGGRIVWGEDFVKACQGATIFLTIPRRPDVAGGLSNRAFWVTATGCFYLTRHKEGIEEFFEPGREIAVFRDHDEMVRKARYYLEHGEERRRMAEAARRRTLQSYTNQHAFRGLLRAIARRGGPRLIDT